MCSSEANTSLDMCHHDQGLPVGDWSSLEIQYDSESVTRKTDAEGDSGRYSEIHGWSLDTGTPEPTTS